MNWRSNYPSNINNAFFDKLLIFLIVTGTGLGIFLMIYEKLRRLNSSDEVTEVTNINGQAVITKVENITNIAYNKFLEILKRNESKASEISRSFCRTFGLQNDSSATSYNKITARDISLAMFHIIFYRLKEAKTIIPSLLIEMEATEINIELIFYSIVELIWRQTNYIFNLIDEDTKKLNLDILNMLENEKVRLQDIIQEKNELAMQILTMKIKMRLRAFNRFLRFAIIVCR